MDRINYEKFFNISPDIQVITDFSGNIKRVNASFLELLGGPVSELEHKAIWDVAHQEDRKQIKNIFHNLVRGHPVLFVENRFRAKNGEALSLRWMAYPESSSELVYFIARISDNQLLDDLNFKMALDASPTAMFIVDESGQILYANPLVERFFKYPDDALIGHSIDELLPEHLRAAHKVHRKEFNNKPYLRPMGTKRLELVGLRQDGKSFPIDVGLNPVFNLRGLEVICSVIDISERKKFEEQYQRTIRKLNKEISALDKLASVDSLTDIWNRRSFIKQLELHLYLAHKKQTPLSLAIIDLDEFKGFNDKYGHVAGDVVLMNIGEVLKTRSRKGDIPARYGGEEFAILMPETDQAEALFFVERIRELIDAYPWKERPVTVSAGISTYIPAGPEPEKDLIPKYIIQADEALYISKHSGKNCSTHYDDIKIPD